MKTKNKKNASESKISVKSPPRQQKTKDANPEKSSKGIRRWASKKISFSMGLRITVSYIKMAADVFYDSNLLIL